MLCGENEHNIFSKMIWLIQGPTQRTNVTKWCYSDGNGSYTNKFGTCFEVDSAVERKPHNCTSFDCLQQTSLLVPSVRRSVGNSLTSAPLPRAPSASTSTHPQAFYYVFLFFPSFCGNLSSWSKFSWLFVLVFHGFIGNSAWRQRKQSNSRPH